MENYKSIVKVLDEDTPEKIKVVKKSIVKPIILIALAFVLIIMSILKVVNVEYFNMISITIAITLLVCGIVQLFRIKKHNQNDYLYEPSGNVLKQELIYLSSTDAKNLAQQIISRNINNVSNIKHESTSGHLLEVLGSEADEYYCLQIKEYIPHTFEAVTPVYIVEGEQAKLMKRFLHS